MTEKVYLTWEDVNKQINNVLVDIHLSESKFTQVVGIKNGGSYPGQSIAKNLGLPYTGIRVSFYKNDKIGQLSDDSITYDQLDSLFDWRKERVLFVDDLYDSGTTYEYIETFLHKKELSIVNIHGFACLYHSKFSSSIGNHFVGSKKPDAWIVLPWETTGEIWS